MTPECLTTRAPAKVNLTLRVVGKRPDGYHELDSLVVFSGVADSLSLAPDQAPGLTVSGDTADAAGPDCDNLVLRAARNLALLCPGLRTGRFVLTKKLPVAAGLGGGSSDAAAALRLLARLNQMAPDDARLFAAAVATGADVPVCLEPNARVMAGIGDKLGPALTVPPLHAVLVNPRVATPTPSVFRALGAGPLAHDVTSANLTPDLSDLVALQRYLLDGGNDLQRPAITMCADIGEAIGMLAAAPGNWLARMSGSGATVFGLFNDRRAAVMAARRMRAARPGWWTCATMLGSRRA